MGIQNQTPQDMVDFHGIACPIKHKCINNINIHKQKSKDMVDFHGILYALTT